MPHHFSFVSEDDLQGCKLSDCITNYRHETRESIMYVDCIRDKSDEVL